MPLTAPCFEGQQEAGEGRRTNIEGLRRDLKGDLRRETSQRGSKEA